MGKREEHGAKGNMHLKHLWTETSSGHVETVDDVDLEASTDGKNLILIESKGTTNMYKIGEGRVKVTKTIISIEELVAFVKENGQTIA